MDNVIITPHIAYNTSEAIIGILNITLDNISASFEINNDTKNIVV
jgi:lactate dehydrogenase-like 2-hydroxyacid dehydrogenase